MMIDATTDLLNLPFDPEFSPGARNAVHVCLRVRPDEKVTVIADRACLPIARASCANWKLGRALSPVHLGRARAAPARDMPPAILEDLETSQVSIFVVQAQTNELKTRIQMTDVVNRRRIRHAHMVNIEPRIMHEGLRADFGRGGRSEPARHRDRVARA
jgi:hypothetical protein